MQAREEWYRKTTWSEEDAADFERHLARARSQRTQYIKIQAQTLAGTGNPGVADAAIDLANRCLREDAEGFFSVEAHLVVAGASRMKQDVASALQSYRTAVAVEARNRGSRCCAYLDFAWFVTTHGLEEGFDEVLDAMATMESEDLVFPVAQYKYFGALAFISEAQGDREYARRMAGNALEAAARLAPFPRHKDVGLVEGIDEDVQRRLREIAAA